MSKVTVIAEAGVNHNGSVELACALAEIAKASGADYVKFQHYHTETMVKRDMADMLKKYELTGAQFRTISDYCKSIGIGYMASCFDVEAVRETDSAIIKIGSGEITNYPLIEFIAQTGKPLIMSTGMAIMDDIFQAAIKFQAAGGEDYSLLHCVSEYPTPPAHCNIQAIETLRYNFQTRRIGFSDHCLYDAPAIMAVSLGATIIEKHFTISRDMDGPDHAMSLEPYALKRYIRGIRIAEMCRGDGDKNLLTDGELEMREKARGRWHG